MRHVLQKAYARSLDEWCATIEQHYDRSQSIALWLFDDEKSRKKAQETMRGKGFDVTFLSAIKPLVQFFREQCDIGALSRVKIKYPVHPDAVENRFRLEAYPLTALLDGIALDFEAGRNNLDYEIELHEKDGSISHHTVFCPNKTIKDWGGQTALTPCGWLRVIDKGLVKEDRAIQTEFEQMFQDGMQAITALPLPDHLPYFEELRIEAYLPQCEVPLGYGHEVLSFQEMLHEEFYFSLLEYFQSVSDLPSGDRSIQPGQIAPFIKKSTDGKCHITIALHGLDRRPANIVSSQCSDTTGALDQAVISAQLASIGGIRLEAQSRCGRDVEARYIKGSNHAVVISGCQHGNETTGTAGALSAANTLLKNDDAHFVISPLENPDGNALYLRLLADNPHHMHHAARYTAYGNDLQNTPDSAPAERAIRIRAKDISSAALHVNLHGYPCHEWIRPLSGYIPRNFALWTLPKGFFVVFRFKQGWEHASRELAHEVTQALSSVDGAAALNEEQVALYRKHAGELDFEIINGIPCSFTCYPNADFCVELITEHPDETIYDGDFRLGQELQKITVVSAYTAWQSIYGKKLQKDVIV